MVIGRVGTVNFKFKKFNSIFLSLLASKTVCFFTTCVSFTNRYGIWRCHYCTVSSAGHTHWQSPSPSRGLLPPEPPQPHESDCHHLCFCSGHLFPGASSPTTGSPDGSAFKFQNALVCVPPLTLQEWYMSSYRIEVVGWHLKGASFCVNWTSVFHWIMGTCLK